MKESISKKAFIDQFELDLRSMSKYVREGKNQLFDFAQREYSSLVDFAYFNNLLSDEEYFRYKKGQFCSFQDFKHPDEEAAKQNLNNDQAEVTNGIHSDEILEKAAFENFEGKLLQGHDLFKIRVFDPSGNYSDPQSEVSPIDDTQLDWWIKEVTHGVNNNPDKAAGFSVFKWDRKDGTWMAYRPDGENQLCYDTGRRSDGTVHEECIQQIPAMIFTQLPEKERTPFNDLLIQSSKSKAKKQMKHNEPER